MDADTRALDKRDYLVIFKDNVCQSRALHKNIGCDHSSKQS